MDLPIAEQTTSLSKKQLDDMREKEVCVCEGVRCEGVRVCLQVSMNYQDELEQQKIDSKNAVEEYVYEMRDKVNHYITILLENVWETQSITSPAERHSGGVCDGERKGGILARAVSYGGLAV